MDMTNFILLLIVSFFTSIIGTMIGMAMVVLLPLMIFLGIPVHTAIATGRFSMLGVNIGNITIFSQNEKVQSKYFLVFAVAGAIGSLAGALFLVYVNEEVLKTIIGIFMIVISILILFEDYIKPKKIKHKATIKHHILSALAGIFVGGYIGIIGGGGATIIILLLILIYGLSFHDALANQKAVTLPISIIAALVFIYQGLIDYTLGVPLLIVNFIGGLIGAGLVSKFKGLWLKRIIVPIVILMAVRLLFF